MFHFLTLSPAEVLHLDPNVLFGVAAIMSAVVPPLATVAVAYLKRRRG